MGFGKAFGIGIVVFIVMNLVWVIIIQLLAGAITIVSSLTNPGALIATLFGSVGLPPFLAFMELLPLMDIMMGGSVDMIGSIMGGLLYIVPGIVTAIICGRMAKKGGAFGAVLLIHILGGILLLVASMMLGATLSAGFIGTLYLSLGAYISGVTEIVAMLAMFFTVLGMIINGIFYGGIAAVSAKSEGY